MLEYYVSYLELALVLSISKTKLFMLQVEGLVSPPQKWCGRKKALFCLRTTCCEIARYNKLNPPTEQVIESYWSKIVEFRAQRLIK